MSTCVMIRPSADSRPACLGRCGWLYWRHASVGHETRSFGDYVTGRSCQDVHDCRAVTAFRMGNRHIHTLPRATLIDRGSIPGVTGRKEVWLAGAFSRLGADAPGRGQSPRPCTMHGQCTKFFLALCSWPLWQWTLCAPSCRSPWNMTSNVRRLKPVAPLYLEFASSVGALPRHCRTLPHDAARWSVLQCLGRHSHMQNITSSGGLR